MIPPRNATRDLQIHCLVLGGITLDDLLYEPDPLSIGQRRLDAHGFQATMEANKVLCQAKRVARVNRYDLVDIV